MLAQAPLIWFDIQVGGWEKIRERERVDGGGGLAPV